MTVQKQGALFMKKAPYTDRKSTSEEQVVAEKIIT